MAGRAGCGRHRLFATYLRTAVARDGDFLPAFITLLQWLDANQRGEEATTLLADKLKQQPGVALLQFTQALALSLQDRGDLKGARQLLESTLARHPENRDVRMTLVAQLRDDGEVPRMKAVIDGLKAINPGDLLLQPTPR